MKQAESDKTLLVLLGPTGVGKTDISLQLAEHFHCPIISSDSRQFYRELKIGTAAPDAEQLLRVNHYFIGSHSIHDEYNAGQYEIDVMELLQKLFSEQDVVMLVGGSMMYIDAVCNGIDDIPSVDAETRRFWTQQFEEKGAGFIRSELKRLDPLHYDEVDLNNTKRILHALEICSITGRPFSEIRTGKRKKRPFKIVKIGLNLPREELYERINNRVIKMLEAGLLEEAKQYYPFRHLNTLNTVGYKELYDYLDGKWTYDFAINMIQQDSRRYAKRQMSWFNRDNEIAWFHPKDWDAVFNYICGQIKYQ